MLLHTAPKHNASGRSRLSRQRTSKPSPGQRFATLTAKVDGHFRDFSWTQAIIIAAVITPDLEHLLAL